MDRDDIALVGLAVMGQNLVLNMERNGLSVAVYNRTAGKTEEFLAGPAAGKKIHAARSLDELTSMLSRPRRIMIMVKAGAAVDRVIDELEALLEEGDVLMDCGNSHFEDTERRQQRLESRGVRFLGVGVSGGEQGALLGPSIMPGGDEEAYAGMEDVFSRIAARVDDEPCVGYIGRSGAGHFVKMVHNGIEYGDMQLIAEAYDLLHRGLGISNEELAAVFEEWNKGTLSSFLIEISAAVLRQRDEPGGGELVEVILDEAGQKGTGRWTSRAAADLGVPVPTIDAAVCARAMSARRDERLQAAEVLGGPESQGGSAAPRGEKFVSLVADALYASKICSYAQGFDLLRAAGAAYGYGLRPAQIARIWRGGCIIRAGLLNDVTNALDENAGLANLLLAPGFSKALSSLQAPWREVVSTATSLGIPFAATCASLAYYDSYRSRRLPANLIQAQRDYFGAHTYKRTDREGTFHSRWGS